MKRDTLIKIIKFLLRGLTRVEYVGGENVPPEGGVILAVNHMSYLDSLVLLTNPFRKDITALAADKYKNVFFFSWALNTAGVIWLDRTKADFGAFRAAADQIKQGVAMAVFPEGTRSRIGQLLPGKPGTILLVMRTGVPVIPVSVIGTENSIPRIFTLQRPRFKVVFGKPIQIGEISRENRDADMQRWTDEIMCQIASKMPERYWGAYRDNPRLKELLAQNEG